ncbi:ABC transporter substrate-binding protein [Frankia sp. AgKG'84/4]|uniref:ABC transporter substrate-binding protein n=1 Tax=Frankia sp. AgKG'84/4 TaxID=573490 RepID=UPI00200E5AC4|nr:ABC transporter substrate-binding protein [Frankia sp. AgKG'84/4]MCL9794304.1 ABC transporter substrate-binding protein [Frankia sp. AgKG'84/4]
MVAVVMLAAGCSGSATAAGNGACGTPGFTPTSVKVGQIYPDTGVLADSFQAARPGVEARLREANAAGGVYGRMIDYKWSDDRGDPAGNSGAAVDLVERQNVFAVFEATLYASASGKYLADHDVPVFGIPAEVVWTKYRNMFATNYSITESGSVDTFGRYLHAQGGTTAVVLRSDLVSSTTDITSKMAQSAASVGITVLPQPLIFNKTVGSVSQVAQEVKASGADVLLGSLSTPEWAEILPAVAQAGVRLKAALSASGYGPVAPAQGGANIAHLSTFVTNVPFEADTGVYKRYFDAMVRYAPETDPRSQLALIDYVQADLFLRGLQAAGPCPSRQQFISSLRAVKDYDADGLLPAPIDLTTSFGKLSVCWAFVQVNSRGDGFDVMHNPAPGTGSSISWCGENIN